MQKYKVFNLRVIQEETAEAFQEAVNKASEELAEYEPEIEFVHELGFCAYIKYHAAVKTIIESVRDEFHLEGIYYHCRNCPHLEDPQDRRVKWCRCKHRPTGKTHKDHEACELFYKWVSQNQIEVIEDKDLILW